MTATRNRTLRSRPRLEIQIFAPATNAQNLHHLLPRQEWISLSRLIVERAKNLCEVCRTQATNRRLTCHERWRINKRTHVQKLIALQAVCPACHNAIHYGRASHWGVSYKKAFKHICVVNCWSSREARIYIRKIQREERDLPSNYIYTVDMSYVEKYGIKLLPCYSRDVEEIVSFDKRHLAKLPEIVVKLSKSRAIAVFHDDAMLMCVRIDTSRYCPRSQRLRLLRNLYKLNDSRSFLVGVYSKKSTAEDVRSDLTEEFQRCEKLAIGRSRRGKS